MKILFVTFFFPKLTETFILNQITNLLDLGVGVEIAAIKNPSKTLAVEDRELEKITQPDIKNYDLASLVTYFPKIGQNIDSQSLLEFVNRKKFDVVHIHWSGLAEEILKDIVFPVPLVVTFQETVIPRDWDTKTRSYNNIFRKANLILPASKYLRESLINFGCPKNKLRVHHMGVDTKLFKPCQKKKGEKTNILSVGSFIYKKGFQDAIEVIKKIKEDGYNFHYVLVGDGQLKPLLKRKVEKYNLKEFVDFRGKLNHTDLIEEYKKADIVFQPSVTAPDGSHEGIPTVLIEASSCSLPVVSTFHTGIPELVSHSNSGFLAKEGSITSLADYLEILIKNPKLRERFGVRGRKIVVKDFNIKNLTNDMMNQYKSFKK